MKRIFALLLTVAIVFALSSFSFRENDIKFTAETSEEQENQMTIDCKSAVLMEASSGKIIYSKNRDSAYSPASVTKVMTLLIVAEAIQSGRISPEDKVTISKNAASMGGSQVFLKEGEEMTVEELVKCTVIASANDCALALAEHTCATEELFVRKMNARAIELGLKSSCFENVTGLDDTTKNHVMSAYDIAVISRELIKHEIILKYSSLWQDSIRDGAFTLTNTNRLVRFYDGCNGLKTGSTDKAGYCVSASAKRDGMQLIAVVMGADSRDTRNDIARELLDFGFANYTTFEKEEAALGEVPVYSGAVASVKLYSEPVSILVKKEAVSDIKAVHKLPSNLTAPIVANEAVGSVEYMIGDEKIGESKVYAKESVEPLSVILLFSKMLSMVFST